MAQHDRATGALIGQRLTQDAVRRILPGMGVQIKASSKGQIVLPKRTRDRLGIASGTVLDVIDTPAGVELRLAKTGKAGTVEDALRRARAAIRYEGPRLDETDWQRGIDEMARTKWGDHRA